MKKLGVWAAQLTGSGSAKRIGLAFLPILAGLSYATGHWQILVIACIAIPVLLSGFRLPQTAPENTRLRAGGEAEFTSAVETALTQSNGTHRCAVVMLELDEIDVVRDTWGVEGLETIVSAIADRLCSMLRNSDIIVQLSESRLAISLPSIRVPELGAVISLIDRLQTAARPAVRIDSANAYVTLSAGFCLEGRAADNSAAALIEASYLALLDAKSQGVESSRGYSAKTTPHFKKPDAHVQAVLRALQDGQIVAWFQPQLSTDTGLVSGFEALARWSHPTRGVLSPAEFLPALETAHAMELLSETMLQHALRAIRAWDVAGHKIPSVAVNFATEDLRNPSLIERIKWDVDRFEIDPARLTVEILETVVSEHDDDIITRNIRALGDQGYRIDLDDFGTGHASLSNIRRFAVDRIKIDRSFITRADEDPEQQRMINAIISMAEQMEIDTVAEGVETIGEKSILSQLGCTHMQGYAIARPMPFEQTLLWLQEHTSAASKASYFPRESKLRR
ncbi:bifunctional diguanylate cyclase/phosphodiesterase [Litoreibacter janthinus]|uniref:EAL domain, c-di-GMP-specific phosphodiesterase class I (Or its enzymatically inactive variant) n=1 Tax=Litoreibacter janthinus TaxID=670154 RepID=A0A1I6HZA1_9RHOB|nr:bifunctional diguanylate cyclase/phosphodiesterase [Litoreibacter janthinus]SFR59540.1 EAL domain, c-di-GMP-specific phosphodiesterase class I (or its enzymatically inactive variant) [Litoreibacter janthinus]